MTQRLPDLKEPVYRIGAVSRLTGIETVTLRMWERRYTVVSPGRSEGRNRLYTREDISRLALIKQLVDEGHAISTVANLSLDELQSRLQFKKETLQTLSCRVAVVGAALPARITPHNVDLKDLDIVVVCRDRGQFEQQLQGLYVDVLVLEYPTVQESTVAEVSALLHRSGAKRAVVVYGFGRQSAVRQLDSQRIVTLRAPVGLAELRRACLGDTLPPARRVVFEPVAVPGVAPPCRYANDTLAQLAAQSSAVHCECPRHLADLLFSLIAFERYSQECRNLSPADAALHAYLYDTTARARAMMEEALARVLEAEGIELSPVGVS